MDANVIPAREITAGRALYAGRLISQIENGSPAARTTLRALIPNRGRAQLIGVTGPPGAGKSTLVAGLIRELRRQDRSVGVIAVDPSSPFSGGALLGDRDRMLEAASGDPGVYIRSLASRGASGGLASAVNDSVDVLDAMGKDVVIVETVGVGQGEYEIAKVAHTVVLVLAPGYGDSLQAMKAGITEIADVVVVNKADSSGAEQTAKELAAHGFERRSPAGGKSWRVPIVTASALRGEGIADVVAAADAHFEFIGASEWRSKVEAARRQAQFAALVADRLRQELLAATTAQTGNGRIEDPHQAADEFVRAFLDGRPAVTPSQAAEAGQDRRQS